MQYFGEYTNYSMHFVRRDLCVSCRKDISLGNITRTDWPLFFSAFTQRCLSGLPRLHCLHQLGYDCYLWNHRGINMTAANVAPFFIGRRDFDEAIISKQMSFRGFVSTYRATERDHLEYPDCPQYTKMKKHRDSLYNRRLTMALGGIELVNEALDIRISRTEISERRNGTWYFWPLNRPKRAFPFGYPPNRAPFCRIVCIDKRRSTFCER
jgi:hypothetical protein